MKFGQENNKIMKVKDLKLNTLYEVNNDLIVKISNGLYENIKEHEVYITKLVSDKNYPSTIEISLLIPKKELIGYAILHELTEGFKEVV